MSDSSIASRRAQLALFFGLAYAFSWLLWLPLVLRSRGIDVPVLPLHHFLGALGPFGAACCVTGFQEGRPGLRRLFARLVPARADVGWLLVALFGPIALFLVAWLAAGWFSGVWSDLRTFGKSAELPFFGLLGTWLFHTLTFGLGEEMGWRGFALPRLQARNSALGASLLLTLAWAGWHFPAFFYRPGYAAMSAGMILGWLLSLATGSVLLTWIFNSTRGSVLAVSLFHGSIDVVFTSDAAAGNVSSVTGTLLMLSAVLVIVVGKPASLSTRGEKVLSMLSDGTTPHPHRLDGINP